MYREARFHNIPCYFDVDTQEIVGKNWIWDKLVALNIWLDLEVFEVDEFQIKILMTKEERDDFFKNY